ncbi:hypothetical protein [Phenylobacterium sp.]|uniref:hypothetical protein n=1 Tax=Phenylobacterium sp. TaxID=1871053 RepID=UPI003566566F
MPKLPDLTDEHVLIAGVAVFVKGRDLHANPPRDNETLGAIGVSPSNLDFPIRTWINAKFRKPNGLPFLVSGDLKTTMTWARFRKAALE